MTAGYNAGERVVNEETRRATGVITMITFIISLLTIFLVSIPAEAQELQISGYYEHTLSVDYSKDTDELIMDASKLRLDFASGLAGGLSFNSNMNYIVYHGEIRRNITPFLPPSVRNVFNQLGLPAEITLPRERLYLDNAYLTWEKGKVRFRAGKQQLAWGSAYSFNPTDLFHQKNMLDPTYEKEGVTAFRFDYRWGIGGQLSLIAAPGDRLAESGYAIRLGTHISEIGYDVALTVHSVTDSTSFESSLPWMPVTQKRRALGLEFTGSLLGLGLWFEGNYNIMETEDDFLRAAIGLDYTLNNGLYFMVETLINQRAETATPYPVHDWLAYLSYGEPISSQWYLVGLGKDIGDLSRGGLYFFATPDGSFVINPRIDISIAQNADLIVFGGFTMGDDEGAFPPGYYSIVTRATVWF